MKKILRRDKILMINPENILESPFQPRKSYDEAKMSGLVQSIRRNGIIQPLSVRRVPGAKDRFELIFGHRRLRASKILELKELPCIVADVGDQNSSVLALTENIQREKLSFFEEARAIQKLISDFKLTQGEASLRLGMTQPTIANKLRLLKLTSEQIERIENFSLTERHARALLRIPSADVRDDVLSEIIIRGLNVEGTEKLIDKVLQSGEETGGKQTAKGAMNMVVNDVRLFVNSINNAVKVMKNSGIAAKTEKAEDENYIRYTVTIPKK